MSHKVHPYAHRLGIVRDWQSRWFGRRGQYQQFLKADVLLREYLDKKLRGLYINTIEIERGNNSLRVIIKTSRPGMLIGRSGEGATKLKNDVLKFLIKLGATVPKDFRLDIEEVKNPESHARIAGQMIVEGLEKRMPGKRVVRQVMDKVMANKNAEGVRVTLSGRLGGAEIGRVETLKKGRLPLQTLRADIDFAREKAYLPYGVIGVKTWIYRGEIFEK
ncbi:MAG: 30S ribosomal protein S3 [Candidatus Vogelbacteria bacterium]|nr:30S ribosomal protein S3 [Candidatus Vogelbacteria bacterium]